ncbi:MAG TPA: SagB/ThcOx family dehydrogenase [bacterium]|nr:SagB/ThcOx family dehydrogenase [bacterium]HQM51868.1 SagB/ThcOx family dehydrogenase [bacterium]
MTEGIGERFQRETKYRPGGLGGGATGEEPPPPYKEYPHAAVLPLPEPDSGGRMSLDSALRKRRSVRAFAQQPLSLGQLSYLLWASTGIQRREGSHLFRTAPSAGALYPIETYLTVNRVEGVRPGMHHYAVGRHALEELRFGRFGAETARAALGQEMCAAAAAVFIWAAVFSRARWRYGQRAYRYVYLDAGHIAENLALAAAALGLGSCQIGALFDDEMNALLGIDGTTESVLYMSAIGRSR